MRLLLILTSSSSGFQVSNADLCIKSMKKMEGGTKLNLIVYIHFIFDILRSKIPDIEQLFFIGKI